MPTANRRKFVPQAFDSFLSQTWEEKELIILDDGEPVDDLVPEGVKYIGLDERVNIPTKRNMVNRFSRGKVIVHWDDDDWSAPERIESQIEFLLATGVDLVGYHQMPFWDSENKQAYLYTTGRNVYACGTSFCYWRRFWELNPFDESIDIASDNVFCRAARIRKNLATESSDLIVARGHSGSTGKKNFGADNFRKIDGVHPDFPTWL